MSSFANSFKENAGHYKQAVKTGLATLICLYGTKAIGLSQGYWAAISSIVVLQSHVGATVKSSMGRFIATALGAIVAAIFVELVGNSYLAVVGAITIAVLLCATPKLRDSYRLAGSTVISVMLGTKFPSPWATAFERFIEVTLGIVVALLVSKILWPSNARQQLRSDLQQIFVKLSSLFSTIIERYYRDATKSVDDVASAIRQSARKIHELRQQAVYEPDTADFSNEMITLEVAHMRRVRQAIDGLELATRDNKYDDFEHKFEPELELLVKQISATFEQLTSKLLTPDGNFYSASLTKAVESLDSKIALVTASIGSSNYPMLDVLHFHSFLANLRSLAMELSLTGQQLVNGNTSQIP